MPALCSNMLACYYSQIMLGIIDASLVVGRVRVGCGVDEGGLWVGGEGVRVACVGCGEERGEGGRDEGGLWVGGEGVRVACVGCGEERGEGGRDEGGLWGGEG